MEPRRTYRAGPAGWALWLALAAPALAAQEAEGIAYFEERVRPLLHDRCVKCHGERKQKSGLRLDSYAAVLAGGERGPAIDRDDPGASRLLRVVRYTDPDLTMPPRGKLADDELAAIERWIELGAPGPDEDALAAVVAGDFDLEQRKDWWSFRPLGEGGPPDVADPAWRTNPIDAFVRARLAEAGLIPAPPADRAALARRLYLDVTGLPPTPEELRAFLDDDVLGAYGRLVDRLLDSPHYAERWARHWLDLVAYAETRGHEFDYVIPNAYQYRDWVIRALEADVPFDRFVTEQVAGDLLDEPRLSPEGWDESVLGTGWWWLGQEVHSPVDIRGDHLERAASKIDTFGKAFLGLTIACARCHDHKFDAIRAEDYYSLAGFVLSSGYRQVRFETSEANGLIAERLAELDAAWRANLFERLQASLGGAREELLAAAGADEPAGPSRAAPLAHRVLDFAEAGPDDFRTDGYGWGPGPRRAGEVRIAPDGALRLVTRDSAVADSAWSALAAPGAEGEPGGVNWPMSGRVLRTPTFRLESGRLWYLVRGAGNAYAAVDSHRLVQGPLHGRLVKRWDAGEAPEAWRWVGHDLSDYAGHVVHVELSPKESFDLAVAAIAEGERPPNPEPAAHDRGALEAALDALATGGLAPQHARTLDALIEDAEGLPWALRDVLATAAAEYTSARAHVTAEIHAESRLAPATLDGNGFDEHLLARGSHRDPVRAAPRGFLEALEGDMGPVAGQGSGRLELAQRMTDAGGPLLARTRVNRVWHHLLGRGIAPSVDDLGRMGEAPTHPELLDWLARWFMESGWSQRELIRLIVTSRTYRMASAGDPAAGVADQENLLFHRANARRLEGEAIRDSILAISGTLDRTRFGPSVALHLTEFMQGRGRPGSSGPLDGGGRRSLYLSVRRNFLHPFLMVWDFPSPANTTGRRTVSNVPAQSLAMMNDPFVLQEARRWAERVVAEDHAGDEARVDAMYVRAFARPPQPGERADALAFVAARRELGSELDAWADLAHVLYNTVELVLVP